MLINFRNALMAGKQLPYDAEIEFLESTGTQCIDTGVNVSTVSNDFRVRGLVKFTDLSAGEHDVLGSGNTRTPTMGRNGAQYFMWAEVSTSWYPASCDMNWHELDFSFSNPSGRTFSVDGNSYSTSSSNKFLGTDLWLFASYPGRYPVLCQIGYIQIFIDNILVRDYIPVRKGAVGYLYDRVSGKLFGNAGTGDFVLGPDVVPVEYIESHGAEWIDTGINALSTTDFDFEITARFPSVPSAGYFGSGYTSSSGVQMFYAINAIATTGLYMACNSTTTIANNLSADKTSWHSARAMSTDGIVRYYFDGVQVSSFASSAFTLPHLYLFAFSDTGGNAIGFGPNQISSFRFSANNTPLRSFLSVRVGNGSTWEGAMMDTLTRRIYRNAGTGAFGYGNDLKYPIPA